jgi:NAD(P)-dependent dehydrogenase (short-subunit alcohol dehydrogenase family)
VRALAAEVRDQGLRVAAVLPTVLDTEANRKAMPDADRSKWQSVDQVVDLMLECAFGEPGDGPLHRVR